MAIVSRAIVLLNDEVTPCLLKQLLTYDREKNDQWTDNTYKHRSEIVERIIKLLIAQGKYLDIRQDQTAYFMRSFTKDFSDSDWEVIASTCKKRI